VTWDRSYTFKAESVDLASLLILFGDGTTPPAPRRPPNWPTWWPGARCRAGHEGCRTPAGWDPEHSDQQTPYTLDQLAGREQAPHPGAYPDTQAYLLGFHVWRALRRDARLSAAEYAVVQPLKDRRMAEKMLPNMPGWTVEEIISVLNGKASNDTIVDIAMRNAANRPDR
jgi:hypothetical protein